MSEKPVKATWALTYPNEGGDKLTVSYDTTSKHLPLSVTIEGGSDSWINYIERDDIPWLCARLLDAHSALTHRETTNER